MVFFVNKLQKSVRKFGQLKKKPYLCTRFEAG